jgi:uncharacterized protein (DUF2147 family)
MRQFKFIVFACVMLAATFAAAAGPDDILGLWDTDGKSASIEIYKCGIKYCGKIAWLKEDVYPADATDGVPGTPILDSNNPDPEMRKKTLIGSPILINFVFAGDDLWTGGNIYNSENGKLYSGRLTLVSHKQLNVRGYIGIPLLGGTTTWTRTKNGKQ